MRINRSLFTDVPPKSHVRATHAQSLGVWKGRTGTLFVQSFSPYRFPLSSPSPTMEFSERVARLQSNAEEQRSAIDSPRKTEHALILPFFKALGYDPFDLRAVEPDFQVGLEAKGMSAVDYALKKEGIPVMLVQCEEAGADLEAYDNSFLFQHFSELGADVVVFTNGLRYQFYANLDVNLNAERHPFLAFDLFEYEPARLNRVRQLARPVFNSEDVLADAHRHMAGRLLRSYFARQQQGPDEHLVRFLAAQIYDGEVPQEVLTQFRPIVQDVVQAISDGNEDILESTAPASSSSQAAPQSSGDGAAPEQDGTALSQTEEDAELESSDSSEGDGTGDQDMEDPFDKDLARRVIDDF